jgi:hypothetical protein
LLTGALQSTKQSRALLPVVAVPVRDEAERLPKLLAALGNQSWVKSTGDKLPIVLVLNNCRDGSASVVRRMAHELPQLRLIRVEAEFSPERAHAGSARRVAMDTAALHGGPRAILISTDADAVPPTNWIEENLDAVIAGADLVGGLIVGDPAEESLHGPGFLRRATRQLRYARLVDELAAILHPLPYDPWPRHTDHTGASLAVRSEVYAQLGGIPAIPTGEDVGFVTKALRGGFRLRHAPGVRVQVSARLEGRAKGGMADCIRGWVEAEQRGITHLVEDPTFVLRRRLLQRSKSAIRLPPEFGDHHIFLNGDGPSNVNGPMIDVDTAIAHLERMIATNGNTEDVA